MKQLQKLHLYYKVHNKTFLFACGKNSKMYKHSYYGRSFGVSCVNCLKTKKWKEYYSEQIALKLLK